MSSQKIVENEWNEFGDLCKKLCENIKLMSKHKKNLSSKHRDESKKARQEVEKLFNETCKIFVYLKSLRQKSLTRQEASKLELNELCSTVDQQSLTVKNVEYERADTLKQIEICHNYNKNTNEPKLVSKKEFYENNPQPKITDHHEEKTKRLEYELKQRKEFSLDWSEIHYLSFIVHYLSLHSNLRNVT